MMGVANAELWSNLGLCCFHAAQYDMTFRCFENALLVADDMTQADIWCGSTEHALDRKPFRSQNGLHVLRMQETTSSGTCGQVISSPNTKSAGTTSAT